MNISNKTFQEVKVLASKWQKKIQVSRESDELHFHDLMNKMLENPMNKIFLIELLDQSFRSKNTDRVADQLEYIFAKYENTDFFSSFEQALIWAFRHLGVYVSSVSIPLFIAYLRNDISTVVIRGENEALIKHIQKRRAEGTRVNLNIIGEMVLGEEEAQGRMRKYIEALENPDIDYLSIKISTIFSQIMPHAHDWTVNELSQRLSSIYTVAKNNTFTNNKEEQESKFVNLDMEEYRDLRLTVDVFKKTLDLEAFKNLYAGIVVQAYLPDTFEIVKELSQWAKKRVESGGTPIKIRLVKGANQEMELVEASLRHWPCVTYMEKEQSDANYKLIMDYLLSKEIAPFVHTGIASHNLFDHALANLLAKERGVEEYYSAEMLEGMSEAAYQVLKDEGIEVLLYAPVATKESFTNAIAYLIRRFDENTAEQNFLRHSFGLEFGSKVWDKLIKSYDKAIDALDDLPLLPYRTQDRNKEQSSQTIDASSYSFVNESDTDFILDSSRIWAEDIVKKWKSIGKNGGFNAHAVVAGRKCEGEDKIEVFDKSQYHDKVIVGSYSKVGKEILELSVNTAMKDPDNWREKTLLERQEALMKVADFFRKRRADLIGVAAAELGKVFTETDVEISEAIDFLNFYPYSVKKLEALNGLEMKAKGVGLVVSPWNFPIAIPVGGIAAALAAGNTVILKPSSDAVLCGYSLCKCFWDAGISKNTLQFIPSNGKDTGEYVVKNKKVDFVIFTGGEETAYQMIKTRPDLDISAETGGKDATIVTALADHDQAVKNVVASAFNNSGQKCSATSLLVLEKEVYEDEEFKKMLADATSSLEVGSVWNLNNRISTLASKPSGHLKKSLSYLDEGESWLIAPEFTDDNNPYMLKPSIRWGTKKDDFCHMNELFGPVLSVMKAEDIEDAINLVNATGYGLTSGLESLDKREQEVYKEKMLAGNLYINRMTTGAIVIRQPFGGMRKSAIGSGKKAGGFNYTSQFMNLSYKQLEIHASNTNAYLDKMHSFLNNENMYTDEVNRTIGMVSNFSHWHEVEFLGKHDYSHIRGESNIIRYLPVKSVLLCIDENDLLEEILASILAIKMVGAKLHVSLPKLTKRSELSWLETKAILMLEENDSIIRDDENSLVKAMKNVERIRYLHPDNVPISIYEKVADSALYIASSPFVAHGRIELMHYFIEQSISDSYHRYGNLGVKGLQSKG